MSHDFSAIMGSKTTEALVNITEFQAQDYQPEAITAAREELLKRGITATQIETLKAELFAAQKTRERFDADVVTSTTRLIHHLLDSIGLMICAFIMALLSFLFIPEALSLSAFFDLLIFLVSVLVYFGLSEYKFQKTPAKFITKTKVVLEDGSRPSGQKILYRTLCRLIPFDNVSFLFTKVGIHDKLSGTRVVKDI
jgi:uncharacterized RDD family membrane protein YckC